jgi:hypothetical protein
MDTKIVYIHVVLCDVSINVPLCNILSPQTFIHHSIFFLITFWKHTGHDHCHEYSCATTAHNERDYLNQKPHRHH